MPLLLERMGWSGKRPRSVRIAGTCVSGAEPCRRVYSYFATKSSQVLKAAWYFDFQRVPRRLLSPQTVIKVQSLLCRAGQVGADFGIHCNTRLLFLRLAEIAPSKELNDMASEVERHLKLPTEGEALDEPSSEGLLLSRLKFRW